MPEYTQAKKQSSKDAATLRAASASQEIEGQEAVLQQGTNNRVLANPSTLSSNNIMYLQRSIGNRAVSQLLGMDRTSKPRSPNSGPTGDADKRQSPQVTSQVASSTYIQRSPPTPEEIMAEKIASEGEPSEETVPPQETEKWNTFDPMEYGPAPKHPDIANYKDPFKMVKQHLINTGTKGYDDSERPRDPKAGYTRHDQRYVQELRFHQRMDTDSGLASGWGDHHWGDPEWRTSTEEVETPNEQAEWGNKHLYDLEKSMVPRERWSKKLQDHESYMGKIRQQATMPGESSYNDPEVTPLHIVRAGFNPTAQASKNLEQSLSDSSETASNPVYSSGRAVVESVGNFEKFLKAFSDSKDNAKQTTPKELKKHRKEMSIWEQGGTDRMERLGRGPKPETQSDDLFKFEEEPAEIDEVPAA